MSTKRTAIIVGTDGSGQSDRAIAWAADEAARNGGSLRVLHVVEPAPHGVEYAAGAPGSLAESWNPLLRGARDLASRRHPELRVETMLVHARNVAEGLRQYADDAAQVVIGHRGRGGFTELLLGSTGLRLAGHCPGAVVVVRGRDDGAAGEIVVGLDLAEDPGPALRYAFAAADAREARLRVLHAWRPAMLAVEVGVDLTSACDTFRGHLAAALAPWRSRHPDVKAVEDVVIGHPVEALVSASANADLVVVGSRGRAVPLGSVSHGAIHHARCPVAVVRPRDTAEPA
ncbi:universal stress protein [Actinomadura macra]|uniref:universal stress protein n=1 Tax=Actinomadura macra TaxID=46164 RepID=UPI00082F944A|nr:universal stress protein [Actinomadura macra]